MALPKNKVFLTAIVVAVFGVLAFAGPVFARELGIVATILSSLAQIIIELVGKLLIVLIEILLAVVKYNDFINAPAVDRGWILVRDVANMAFLIIFIAIAFATILGVEKYEWKRLLPKLLIMAVAINFSKTICGIIIDAAQVVMITFVNGFKNVAAGNLIRGFGLNDMLAIRDLGADENVTDTAVAAASILAVILLVIAGVTVGVIVLMFLARIMFLWILIILSPLAFIMAATPGAENQFQKWFQQLIKYAFVGPIMAFFLWLSFSIMAGVAPGSNLAQDSKIFRGASKTGITEPAGNTSAAISGISRSDQLLSYAIAIALLLLSLSVANSLGVAGGSIAGKALDKIKSGGVKLGKLAALGVATGGVGSALGIAGAYKGRKWIGKRADDLLGPRLTRGIGKAGAKVFGDTRAGRFFKPIAKHGIHFRSIPKGWSAYKERREAEKLTRGEGAVQDSFMGALQNRKTTLAEQREQKLVNERAKELGETSTETDYIIQEFKNSHASGDRIGMKAAIMNLVKQNDQNSLLNNKEIADVIMPIVQGKMSELFGDDHYKKMYADHEGNMPNTVADPTHWVEFMREYLGDDPKNAKDTARFESTLSNIALEKGSVTFFGTTKLDIDTGEYDLKDLTYYTPDDPGEQGNLWDMTQEQREAHVRSIASSEEQAEKMVKSMEEYFGYVGAVLGKGRNFRGADFQNFHPTVFRNEIDKQDGTHGYSKTTNPLGTRLTNQLAGSASERNFRGGRGDTTEGNAGHHYSAGDKPAADALADFYWDIARKTTNRAALQQENGVRAKFGMKELKNDDDPTVSREVLEQSGIFNLSIEQQEERVREMAQVAYKESLRQQVEYKAEKEEKASSETQQTPEEQATESEVGESETQKKQQEVQNTINVHQDIQQSISDINTQLDAVLSASEIAAGPGGDVLIDVQRSLEQAQAQMDNSLDKLREVFDKLTDEQKQNLGDLTGEFNRIQGDLQAFNPGASREERDRFLKELQDRVRRHQEKIRDTINNLGPTPEVN